jgi:hypothetical protein
VHEEKGITAHTLPDVGEFEITIHPRFMDLEGIGGGSRGLRRARNRHGVLSGLDPEHATVGWVLHRHTDALVGIGGGDYDIENTSKKKSTFIARFIFGFDV